METDKEHTAARIDMAVGMAIDSLSAVVLELEARRTEWPALFATSPRKPDRDGTGGKAVRRLQAALSGYSARLASLRRG